MSDLDTKDDRTRSWNELAAQIGIDSIRCTTEAGSGHPTSSLSAAHLTAVLFADHLRTDVKDPRTLATTASCSRRVMPRRSCMPR